MHVLRTPADRFADLPGFPYPPHHVEVDDGEGGRLRVTYLDEGPRGGETVLLMHAEPSWSCLYRRVIPPLVSAGCGCSPRTWSVSVARTTARREDYTDARHVDWMRQALLDGVGLDGVTLVGLDWGGLIGLRLVAENPDRFARVVVANTGLPTGDHPMSEAFLAWQRYSQDTPELRGGPDRLGRVPHPDATRRGRGL